MTYRCISLINIDINIFNVIVENSMQQHTKKTIYHGQEGFIQTMQKVGLISGNRLMSWIVLTENEQKKHMIISKDRGKIFDDVIKILKN